MWQGSHRSGVTLAMHRGLDDLSIYRFIGQHLGDEHFTLASWESGYSPFTYF